MIVGAATVAARRSLPGKGRRTGTSPAPTIFPATQVVGKPDLFLISLDRFYAKAFIQVVIKIVEVEYCAIQDKRQLRYVSRIDDQVEIS